MPRKKDFNFDEMLGVGPGGPANTVDTGIQEYGSVDDQGKPGTDIALESGGSEVGLQSIIADLLAAHVGLRTGLAKKTTFDFTPEFARALKKWSVDVDTPMRDLVVKAVAQAIPIEYIQEYRNTGKQKKMGG
jgi:hypothetical protein